MRNHGGGIRERDIMKEASWRRHHGGVIMEEASWRSHHGGVIMEESSWRSHHGGVKHVEKKNVRFLALIT